MSKSKSAVRRPQSSKRARDLAKVVALYSAGTGESVSEDEYGTDAR